MKRFLIILFIIHLFNFNVTYAQSLQIQLKVNNSIFTNIDLDSEIKYLLFLNENLRNLPKEKVYLLAKNSLINGEIKRQEVEKFYNLEKDYNFTDKIVGNILKQKNIKNKNDLKDILNSADLNYRNLLKKIKIDALWNQIIFNNFNKNIKVNEDELEEKIKNYIKTKEKKYEYNISEILLEKSNLKSIEQIYKEINNSINEIGFENTANIKSVSESSKFGGKIGWIKESQLSNLILKKIKSLQIGDNTKIIEVTNGYLILKVNNKKEVKEKIDLELELKNLIFKEKDRQLNLYSQIYYKKLKRNASITEF
tara:strand:- start:300 stop:1229 length:930 start_codon:yes stop_codon:yes gene_type:complete